MNAQKPETLQSGDLGSRSNLIQMHIKNLKARTQYCHLPRGERLHVHTVMKPDTLIKWLEMCHLVQSAAMLKPSNE